MNSIRMHYAFERHVYVFLILILKMQQVFLFRVNSRVCVDKYFQAFLATL